MISIAAVLLIMPNAHVGNHYMFCTFYSLNRDCKTNMVIGVLLTLNSHLSVLTMSIAKQTWPNSWIYCGRITDSSNRIIYSKSEVFFKDKNINQRKSLRQDKTPSHLP